MNSKQYRMSELLNPADGHSLVIDTSNGLVLGALPGLEHFEEAVQPVAAVIGRDRHQSRAGAQTGTTHSPGSRPV